MKRIFLITFTFITILFIVACTPTGNENIKKLSDFADSFSFDTSLKNDLLNIPNKVNVENLGEISISFKSSNTAVILENGTVVRQSTDQEVEITITFEFENLKETRIYFVTVNRMIEQFTVSFITDNLTNIPNQTIDMGLYVTRPTDPVKEGYVFDGWLLEGVLYDFGTPVNGNITLVAKWTQTPVSIQYTLTFDTDGGSVVIQQTIDEQGLFIEPSIPTKEGYRFDGWYLDTTFETVFDFSIPATNDLTIYAKWVIASEVDPNVIFEHNFTESGKVSSVLSFDSNNSTSSNYDSYEYNDLLLTLGYKIDGQGQIKFTTTQADTVLRLVLGRRKTGAGGVLEGQSIVKIGSFTQSFTEQFIVLEITLATAQTYTIERESSTSKEFGVMFIGLYRSAVAINEKIVTFDTQGGSTLPSRNIEVGATVPLPNEPTKADFDFLGWSTNKETFIVFDFSTPITEDLTLYAFWGKLETYTVTADGVDYEVKQGHTLPPITPQVIEGKVFLGWLLDGITFDVETPIESDLVLTPEYRDAQTYEVTLELNGGLITSPNVFELYEYEDLVLPIITKTGYLFVGWYLDQTLTVAFIDNKLTADITLYAKFIDENDPQAQVQYGSYFEAIYATWQDSKASSATVSYKKSSDTSWIQVDKELIRQTSPTTARVDVVGISEGYYDLKIETATSQVLNVTNVFTKRNDRSGYAHFNYTEGIGGYTDSGTLKPNAIVVYVTESNKNSITIPGIGQTGLGWILNNNQYFSGSSNTNSTQDQLSSLAFFNQPIVFRIIGKVTAPEGLTIYNSTQQGGSVGDNGNMARIRNANHITIEGIGEDAEIYGWGIHFMAMASGRGIGFEAKNLTFRHYPEDAIGLEGVQSGSTLTTPVQRGWIHHVTFHEGFHPNPAESDKSNGDGSLDIKRGEYFTIAYNQFLGAHKTNLVGSSDTSLQYHITYHHNHWQNNASRIPLARNANIHMYNNIFETTNDNQNEASYAQNTRANAYIFSEANYFIGTKNPSRVDSGAIKSWGDVKYSTHSTDGATVVQSRAESVSSGNRFENFDTNPEVFYYDAVNQRSDVEHLTDAITARADVMMYAGHYRPYQTPVKQRITHVEPTILTDSISLANTKIQKGVPLLVFQVLAPAEVVLTSGSTSVPPVLVTIYGEVLLTGVGTIEVQPGIYVIESSQAQGASKGTSQAKESNAGYVITVDGEAQQQARIDYANSLIDALPEVITYTLENKVLLEDAMHAYHALSTDEKLLVNGVALLNKQDTYYALGKAYIENLINQIGTVTETSLNQITSARVAYDTASPQIQSTITNYQVLLDAEDTFETFKINAIINQINDLINIDTIGIDAYEEIMDQIEIHELIKALFDQLTPSEQNQITNQSMLLDGLDKLYEMKAPYDIVAFINTLVLDDITRQNLSSVITNYNLYTNLDEKYLSLFTTEQVTKLNEAWAIVEAMQGNSYKYVIDANINTNNYFTYIGDNPVKRDYPLNIFGYDIELTAKLNSSASFTFTTSMPNSTLIIVVSTRTIQSDGRLSIDGTIYNLDSLYGPDGVAIIEVTLEQAKTYTISRSNRELVVYYIEVIE